jgi:hypothetical protein
MRGGNPASPTQKTMKNKNHNKTQGTPRIGSSAVLENMRAESERGSIPINSLPV